MTTPTPSKSNLKKILAVVVILIVLGAGAGAYYLYSSSSSSTTTMMTSSTATSMMTTPITSQQMQSLKVAILLPGEKNDLSWNQAAYSSFVTMTGELNATGKYNLQTSVAEGLYTPADITPAMQSLGTDGYNLVIGDGFQYTAPAMQLASTYPNTGFLIPGGYESTSNVQSVMPETGSAGFLLGVLAALYSHTGKVAAIGGENVSEITWVTKGFVLGVDYANANWGKNVQVLVTFIGNFDDPAAAKSAAAADVAQGADVLYCSGDGISVGVANEAVAANVGFLYNDFNQTSLAPSNTLGGLSYSLAPVFNQALNDWMTNHTFSSTTYYATFQNGGQTMDMTSLVPASTVTIIHTLYQGLLSQKLRVYEELPNGTLTYNPITPAYSSL
jgi:basic membrane protein A